MHLARSAGATRNRVAVVHVADAESLLEAHAMRLLSVTPGWMDDAISTGQRNQVAGVGQGSGRDSGLDSPSAR